MLSKFNNSRKLHKSFCCHIEKRYFSDYIRHSELIIERTEDLKEIPENSKLEFGKYFTDHMLEIDWNAKKGWSPPIIRPFRNLELSPGSLALHYGLSAFEGLKAYHDYEQNLRLFRPEMNMTRLNRSIQALNFPTFDEEQMLLCVEDLVRLEERWVPDEVGYSLYIRPCAIATTPKVKVAPTDDVKVFVITCPVGPYYKSGFSAISLLATDKHVRAWPGGYGAFKLGGNYGPTIKPQAEAEVDGYEQILWLLPREDKLYVSEVGSMNLFFFWVNKAGERELITAPLDGTILPGITRDSVLALSRQWGEFKVTERLFTIDEVVEAVQENRMLECFGTGTAAIISPVDKIGFQGKDYQIPLDPNDSAARVGPLADRLFSHILNIQYGFVDSPIDDDGRPWSKILPHMTAKHNT